jgi:hypothetical protein
MLKLFYFEKTANIGTEQTKGRHLVWKIDEKAARS